MSGRSRYSIGRLAMGARRRRRTGQRLVTLGEMTRQWTKAAAREPPHSRAPSPLRGFLDGRFAGTWQLYATISRRGGHADENCPPLNPCTGVRGFAPRPSDYQVVRVMDMKTPAQPRRWDARASGLVLGRSAGSAADLLLDRCADVLLDLCQDRLLGHEPDERLDRLAAPEKDQGRAAPDPKLTHHLRILVDVDLGDLQLAFLLVGDLLQMRSDHLAGLAPLGPEIDEDWRIGLENFGLECAVGDGHGMCHRVFPLWRRTGPPSCSP